MVLSLQEVLFVEEQVFKTADYAAGQKPYLVLTTPIGYNSDRKYYQDEQYFYNATGEIARCYELHVDDIFTVSADAITALATAPVVGNYVSVDGGLYKGNCDCWSDWLRCSDH